MEEYESDFEKETRSADFNLREYLNMIGGGILGAGIPYAALMYATGHVPWTAEVSWKAAGLTVLMQSIGAVGLLGGCMVGRAQADILRKEREEKELSEHTKKVGTSIDECLS